MVTFYTLGFAVRMLQICISFVSGICILLSILVINSSDLQTVRSSGFVIRSDESSHKIYVTLTSPLESERAAVYHTLSFTSVSSSRVTSFRNRNELPRLSAGKRHDLRSRLEPRS